MRNIRLDIEYDGTNYCGWQVQSRQKAKKSIQGALEQALRKLTGRKVTLAGSGRTDAGVHALRQVAHFKTDSRIPSLKLQKALNALLPPDIAVTAVKDAVSGFHSRFWAVSKVYRYTILNRPYRSAFLRHKAYFCPWKLDLALMKREARALVGRHDFSSFKASGAKENCPVKTVERLSLSREGQLIHIDIQADGFLYNMVRVIVGTLVDIGRGRLKPGSMKRILQARDRKLAGMTAPAEGLYLVKVRYKKT